MGTIGFLYFPLPEKFLETSIFTIKAIKLMTIPSTIKNEKILTALVSSLNENQALIESMPDENIKQAVYHDLCEQVFAKYEEETSHNLRAILKYLSDFNTTEEIIENMNSRVNHTGLVQSEIREERDGFDAKYGTRTRDIVEQFEMNEAISLERFINSTRYYPSPISSVRMALGRLVKHQVKLAWP